MTMAGLKRKWPTLVRRAERSARIKFKRKPVVRFRKRAYAHSTVVISRDRSYVKTVEVNIPKRMAKENQPLAEVCALHELRESLFFQRGYTPRQSDLKAQRFERGDIRRAGFRNRKRLGPLLKKFYGRKSERKPFGFSLGCPYTIPYKL